MLVAVFASGLLVARSGGYRRFRHQTEVVLAAGLAVALLGLAIKLQHAAVTAAPDRGPAPSVGPGLMEIARAYDTPGLVRELRDGEAGPAMAVAFPVERSGANFGDTAAGRIELKQPGWVRTNAVVFPWLELMIDGQKARADQLARTDHFLAVYLPAGRHELSTVWRPDPVWWRLNRLSQAGFALVLLITLGWSAVRGWRGASLARVTP
jgi:hypothetical protein